MKAVILALLLAACGAAAPGPDVVIVTEKSSADVGVVTALKHTRLADDLGCTVVDLGRGIVATAKHCVDELEAGEETSAGVVVYQDPLRDFAFLYDLSRANGERPTLRAPRLGEHVYTVGYPVQVVTEIQELTVTDGVFAGPSDGEGHLRITAPIYFGNSGGGCWGEDGALVGITVSGVVKMPGMNYIVPADAVALQLP
jgi:S1-C subfamily serine protease